MKWKLTRFALLQCAIIVAVSLVLVIVTFLVVGLRNSGRLIGAAYLMKTAPNFSPRGFSETFRALVLTDANSWVEGRYIAKGLPMESAVATVKETLLADGLEKRMEKTLAARAGEEAHWLLFTSKKHPRFCFSVVLKSGLEGPTSTTIADTVYKFFSERQLEAEEFLIREFKITLGQ
jgi:hypothetical protein